MKSLSAIMDVSRETVERLELLQALLIKWNPAINLVAKSTLPNAWERHIADSAQIYNLGHTSGDWVDLGSGGGFPGLVIAILAAGRSDPIKVTLVEADQRKATFLRTASQQLGLSVITLSERIEKIPPLAAKTLSARALAPLPTLLAYADRHLESSGIALFPKGASWKHEVDLARKDWHFNLEAHPSVTDTDGAVLAVRAISHV